MERKPSHSQQRSRQVSRWQLGGASGLPELQQAVLAVRADQVLVGVVGDADHVLLVDLQQGAAKG